MLPGSDAEGNLGNGMKDETDDHDEGGEGDEEELGVGVASKNYGVNRHRTLDVGCRCSMKCYERVTRTERTTAGASRLRLGVLRSVIVGATRSNVRVRSHDVTIARSGKTVQGKHITHSAAREPLQKLLKFLGKNIKQVMVFNEVMYLFVEVMFVARLL